MLKYKKKLEKSLQEVPHALKTLLSCKNNFVFSISKGTDYLVGHVVTGYMVAVSGLVLTVISLLAASISCCCAPTEEHVSVWNIGSLIDCFAKDAT